MGQDPLALDPYNRPDAFTCALLDIAGQAYGIPLHRFFGAQVRDKVPVSYWSCPMTPEETAAEAEIGAEQGFSNHKLKARSWNIVETVRLMKEAAGADYTVGVDPNTEFGLLPTGARLAGELEPFGTVSVFEDPLLKNNLEWYRILREKTHIPIALHLGAPSGVLAALKAECIDYVNLGGSALQVRKAAALAEAADVPCWIQMGGLCTGGAGGLLGGICRRRCPMPRCLATSCPLRGRPMLWLRGWRWRRGILPCPQGRGWGLRWIWRWWSGTVSLEKDLEC